MITEKRFDRLYGVLAFASMYFMAASFIVPTFASVGSAAFLLVGAIFVLVCMLGGYFLQAFFCFVTKFERRKNDNTYEATVKYYSIGRATPVIALAVLIFFGGSKLFMHLYRELAYANHDILYDSNSLLPFALAFVIAVLLVLGSAMWFFPYRRFTLLRVPMTCLPLLVISFFFASQFGGAGSVISAVCLFGYTICTMVLINQSTVTGCCKGFDSVSFLNGRARAYNVLMTLSLLTLFGVTAAILFVLIAGLLIIGRFLLVLFFLATNRPDDPIEMQQYEFGSFVLGETAKEKAANTTIFTVFIALLAFVIVVLLMRRSDLVIRMLSAIKKWLSELFEFFFAFAEKKNKGALDDEEGFRSYKDEERRKQKAKISPYEKKIAETRSYKDFIFKLGSFKEKREKLGFAYASLVSRVMGMQKFVKKSDTPREIARKLESDPLYDGINGITEAFEIAAYSKYELPDEKYDVALATLCNMMKKHLD